MADRPDSTIYYLPFANVPRKILFMGLVIAPFSLVRDRLLEQNAAAVDKLDCFFSNFETGHGRPVVDIPIVYRSEPTLKAYSENEMQVLNFELLFLFFWNVFWRAKGDFSSQYWQPLPTAESFLLHTFHFSSALETYSVTYPNGSGMIGANVRTTKNSVPEHLLHYEFRFDPNISDILSRCFKAQDIINDSPRIYRALEAFFTAHMVGMGRSFYMRFIMFSTSFELLCGKSGRDALNRFVDDCLLRNHEFLKENRFTITFRLTVKKLKAVLMSRYAAWAWDFYRARNAMVHDLEINRQHLFYESEVPNLQIAVILFADLLVLELSLIDTIRNLKPSANDNHEFEMLKHVFLDSLNLRDIYEYLRWLPQSNVG